MIRTEDVTGITIWAIIAWIIWFPPSLWVGFIPVYLGTALMLEIIFITVLLLLWVWVLWT